MKISPEQQLSLQSLKSEFEKFRATSRRGAKIPEDLRRGFFAAIESGINPSRVKSTLGVTNSQLMRWARQDRKLSPVATSAPRVLEVIPSAVAPVPSSGLRVSYEVGRLVLEFSF